MKDSLESCCQSPRGISSLSRSLLHRRPAELGRPAQMKCSPRLLEHLWRIACLLSIACAKVADHFFRQVSFISFHLVLAMPLDAPSPRRRQIIVAGSEPAWHWTPTWYVPSYAARRNEMLHAPS